ncbi:MAG: hypothetical protein ABFR63_03045 [Thermodesulfobacteriota bacterium]
MKDHSIFIIFLWLLPIVAFVCLPFAFALVRVPLDFLKRKILARKTVEKERRRHLRFVPSKDTFAELTVGDTVLSAQVADISQNGISLKHLPEMISYDIDGLSVVIREYGMDCKLMLKTTWVELKDSGKQLGARIDIPSPLWTNFLLQTEKVSLARPA